jgi:hypothetical protein
MMTFAERMLKDLEVGHFVSALSCPRRALRLTLFLRCGRVGVVRG